MWEELYDPCVDDDDFEAFGNVFLKQNRGVQTGLIGHAESILCDTDILLESAVEFMKSTRPSCGGARK